MGVLKNILAPSRSASRARASLGRNYNLFEYTKGRFLFNEELRRNERRINFNPDALAATICHSVNRSVSELISFEKLAEGGFNRVFEATFTDGYAVLARLPFRITSPIRYAVASEAATLGFLRANSLPVPKVLAYSCDNTNPVGAEYLILEKIEGKPLSDQWFTMDTKICVKIMRQIVELEARFMSLSFPASGSLYYQRDLNPCDRIHSIEGGPGDTDQFVVGPTAQHAWWYRERARLDVDRGPWTSFLECTQAPAKREIQFCNQYGKPRLHVERYLRELQEFRTLSPKDHALRLFEYLQLTLHLDLPSTNPFARPLLRHPDFSLSNILINPSDNTIAGVIDWQHATVLPLCLCAGIPRYFQNWGDSKSEALAKPETKLPDGFDDLPEQEQDVVQETMRKRLVHFYYAAYTMRKMPDHFDALRDHNAILRAKLFDRASAPWEGDSLSLKHTILQVQQNWPMRLTSHPPVQADGDCPVKYSQEERYQCVKEHEKEEEKLQELSEMREMIGIDQLGWVPDDDHLEKARDVARMIKQGLLEHSSTEIERLAILNHFPFDDHDEEE
ncbi:hypothetical protein LOZ12_002321 [Ophidiomyces ophidiicola]|uniref:Uncharacterized protein n=1 Tax=Ophidiomyces ophidiicola TaxID=1387563 RepID=A0ACB8V3L2_9EURO|nr:uncharacterized protein LOZ57_000834 [Ophidiomyces ophidiicola]KAI1952754.1 hypothetical protein LOZ57_000834 [Ophidiomyces ophidiicola]KAI1954321.1 hypothetical protein LOZ62_000900 [Ophidiomyces ophidiicola]KAI1975780.1 hypothetical protein LOZ56_000371 [Ophidiomyces ophidiicola]KAI2012008.1 hypothetical protein LOZ50_000329 [Ophidiomyces ophidiicola]KAI2030146.1 hypothetical protein LOZ45_001683 [Ophidiomyces ophidiicola]